MSGSAADAVETALADAFALVDVASAPPRIVAAMRHAVFPGGARVRPGLCLAVARSCGAVEPTAAARLAAAVELLHAASLVHDDLPCFDDAAFRRGRKSVHRAFGVPLAVLAGDGLIALAFELTVHDRAPRAAEAVALLAASISAGSGLVAGQAWESEPCVPLERYHAAKTGALFEAAAALGALATGADIRPWRTVGARLGEAYQIADDVRDVTGSVAELGKPTGRDAALRRPNAVGEIGLRSSNERAARLVRSALAAVPDCEDRRPIEAFVAAIASRAPRDEALPDRAS